MDGPGEFFICRSSDDKEVISENFHWNFNDRLVPMIFIIVSSQANIYDIFQDARKYLII